MKNEKPAEINFIKKTMHFFYKCIFYLFLLFLIFIFIILTIYVFDLINNSNNNETTVPIFGAYVIISPSMVPTINVQDGVIVKRMKPENLKKGDIITFISSDSRYSGLTITHRISEIKKDNNNKLIIKTKGDNNNIEDDSYVNPKDVYGKVIFKIPYIGYIQSFLSNAYGWVLLIIFPCLIIIVFDLVKLVKIVKSAIIIKKNKNNKSNFNNPIKPIHEKASEEITVEKQQTVEVTTVTRNEAMENSETISYKKRGD